METWFVMADGTCGDPREIVRGADGLLRHKDGRAVAYAPHGPRTRSVDPSQHRVVTAAPAAPTPGSAASEDEPPKASREMKAEGGKSYRTRASKAD